MPADPRPLLSVGDGPTAAAGSVYLRSVGDLATALGDLPADAPTRTFAVTPPPGYAIDKELGRGAFGVVYLARPDRDPDTPVALKVIATQNTTDRLTLEWSLLARLDHPNIVREVDCFPHPDGRHLVIALEYVGGGDLKAAIDECDRFPPGVVRDLLVQLGGALAEAHGKGVVHRDLKPANVLLDRTGPGVRYVLTDFGVGAEDAGIRANKTVAGTYLYMAPEQLRGRPGPQSDLWALGVVAYRMLTGRYPFPGPSAAELARQIQLTTPPPPSEVTGEPLDPDLERAVLRLLDRSETERIGSAGELLRELGAGGVARSGLFARAKPKTDSRLGERVRSLGETLDRDIARAKSRVRVWAGLYLVSTGILGGVLQIAAAVLFYRVMADPARAGRRKRLAGAFALMFVGTLAIAPESVGRQLMFGQVAKSHVAGAVLVTLFGLFSTAGQFVFPILGAAAFARANRLRRERVLLRAAAAGVSSDEYLSLLRAELDNRYEDVGFHLKYAEALAARGDDRGAAVEARLLLVQDPYHFTGNLLLAQCYLRLGLADRCRAVCDDYLAVSGYCFEFAELRGQCGPGGAA